MANENESMKMRRVKVARPCCCRLLHWHLNGSQQQDDGLQGQDVATNGNPKRASLTLFTSETLLRATCVSR